MKRPLDQIQAFRAQELLLARATEGLGPAEHDELATLGADDDVSFDLAAAALDVATLRAEPMPASVADKILLAAGVAPARASQPIMPSTLPGVMPAQPIATRPQPPAPQPEAPVIPIGTARRARSGPVRAVIAAWTAAAAGLLLAVGAMLWASQRAPEVREIVKIQVPATPSPSEARSNLLANAPDVKQLAWALPDPKAPDPAAKGATGDVVWSAAKQQGYMRFVGLAPNDPKKLQYQLWIFDKNRDDKYPVDGGVFDVSASGEVVVAISARIPVTDATLFAVTVEAPGGVVVSKRERLVMIAKPS